MMKSVGRREEGPPSPFYGEEAQVKRSLLGRSSRLRQRSPQDKPHPVRGGGGGVFSASSLGGAVLSLIKKHQKPFSRSMELRVELGRKTQKEDLRKGPFSKAPVDGGLLKTPP